MQRSQQTIRAIIDYKPKGVNLSRAHIFALTILDTGLRAREALGLKKDDVDWDSMVLKVKGKGNKHRLVPLSFELRKVLYRYVNPAKVTKVGKATQRSSLALGITHP